MIHAASTLDCQVQRSELRFEGSLEDEDDLKTGWKVDSHEGWPQNSRSSGASL
jgi:hypothetical protein